MTGDETRRDGGVSLDGIYRPLRTFGEPTFGLLRLREALAEYPVNLDPDFQRGHVWTEAQQRLFVAHVLEGGHVQPLIVNAGPAGTWVPAEMVDGKQRVTACVRWAKGEIPALLSDGRELYVGELDGPARRLCGSMLGLRFAVVHMTRAESLELYLKLNRGGTVHTEEEIARVRELLERERSAAGERGGDAR